MSQEPRHLESTTAFGPMLARNAAPLVIGLMLATPGTSSGAPLPPKLPGVSDRSPSAAPVRRAARTGTDTEPSPQARLPDAIAELRRVSGLTWEQLAQLFGTSRRALHFWAAGKRMSAANAEHLQRLVAVLQQVDRGSASANRSALLSPSRGTLPFDLLARHDYESAVRALGPGPDPARTRPSRMRPSAATLAARGPRPPGQLVDALEGQVHGSGRIRKVRSVKVRGGN